MSLAKYKTQISLPDYIMSTNLGFEVDKMSSNHNVRLIRYALDKDGSKIKKSGGGFQKEYSWVFKKKANGIQVYFDFQRSENKHYSVIDYVHEHVLGNNPETPPNFSAIGAILDRYMESEKFVTPAESKFNLKHHSKSNSVNDRIYDNVIKESCSLSDAYFRKREIPAEVYKHPMWANTFGTHEKTIQTAAGAKLYRNHSFLFRNNKGQITCVQDVFYRDGKKEKRYNGSRGQGVCMSGFNNSAHKKTFILSESPEDAKSHYTIFNHRLKQRSVAYHCYGGAISQNQLAITQQEARKEGVKDYVLSFDPDRAGEKYNVKASLLLSIDLRKEKSDNVFEVRQSDGVMSIVCENSSQGSDFLIKIRQELQSDVDILKAISDGIGTKPLHEHEHGKISKLNLPDDAFFVEKHLLPIIAKASKEDISFVVHKSKAEDWNQQLKQNMETYKRPSIADDRNDLSIS